MGIGRNVRRASDRHGSVAGRLATDVRRSDGCRLAKNRCDRVAATRHARFRKLSRRIRRHRARRHTADRPAWRYARQPWFFGGAVRFTAVQTGGIERLVFETAQYLAHRGRAGDLLQTMRLGEMRVALRTALHWLDAGADAWSAYDAGPGDEAAAQAVVEAADGARIAIEGAALSVIERAMRAIGARGLQEPLPFVRLVRDLEMYLRQPAPDAAIARVGRAAFEATSAQRSAASATVVGSGGTPANV